jgi:hypothetical protein
VFNFFTTDKTRTVKGLSFEKKNIEVLLLTALVAIAVQYSLHRVEEGHVGVYFRGGAMLQVPDLSTARLSNTISIVC